MVMTLSACNVCYTTFPLPYKNVCKKQVCDVRLCQSKYYFTLHSLISTCAALHFDTKYKPIFFLIDSGCEKEDLKDLTIQFFFQNKINNTYGQSDIYLHTYLCGRVISIIVHLVKILPQWILQCTQDHQCMHSNTIFFLSIL